LAAWLLQPRTATPSPALPNELSGCSSYDFLLRRWSGTVCNTSPFTTLIGVPCAWYSPWIWWIIPISPSDRIRTHFCAIWQPRSSSCVFMQLAALPPGASGAGRSRISRPQAAPSGAGTSGTASSSRTVQRRFVSPAAIAGVR